MHTRPGGIFYNTGIQQQRLGQHFQQNFNTLYGPFGIPLGQQSPYCQNCDCDGCKIYRERLRLQQEEDMQRKRIQDQAIFHMHANPLFDAEKEIAMKPGSVIPLDVKPGIVTEEWWAKNRWKFLFWWTLAFAAVLHLATTCATRQV